MADLQTRLTDLGARWDAPTAPDLVAAVLAARGSTSPMPRRTRPRRIVLALAATVLALGTVAAIAPARNAVLRFFDIGGVRVVSTAHTTPPAPSPTQSTTAGTTNPLGQRLDVAQARERAPFALRLPGVPASGPDEVFVQTPPRDGAYALVWRHAQDVARGRLILTEFRGQLFAEKLLDPAVTTVQTTNVDGVTGLWLSGGPHTFGYVDSSGAFQTGTTRAVGDVLIWERSGVTYRIEGASSLTQALRVAASLR